MTHKKGETVDVQDKPAEIGIKLNNILTALILMVMSWVGVNITTLKEDIGEIKTEFAVGKNDIQHLKERLRSHINDQAIHTMGHTHAD